MADSGRQEVDKPVFAPLSNTEQKPNLKHQPTPQGDFIRQKISPNAAEGKERLGLKDLATLLGGQGKDDQGNKAQDEPVQDQPEPQPQPVEPPKKQRSNRHKNKKKANKTVEKQENATPVVPSVRPEIEYQEKSTVAIEPTHDPLPLSTPVKSADEFAKADNSMDGFLSVKH